MKRRWRDPAYRAKRQEGQAAAKRKQAEAQRRRWADEGYRGQVREALRGREAWNKGRPLSVTHKQKIREAKMGSAVSPETRAKISAAKQGAKHSAATRAKMSGTRKGRKLGYAHKRAIAAALRKKHGSLAEEEAAGGAGGAAAGPAGASSRWTPPTEKVRSLQNVLKEYKKVKGELQPWVSEFVGEHGRPPTLQDVEYYADPATVAKYRLYLSHKQNLFVEIPQMRSRLDGGRAALGKAGGGGPAAAGGDGAVVRASAMLRAEEYKQQQGAGPGPPGAGAGAPAETSPEAPRGPPARTPGPALAGTMSPKARAAFAAAAKYKKKGGAEALVKKAEGGRPAQQRPDKLPKVEIITASAPVKAKAKKKANT